MNKDKLEMEENNSVFKVNDDGESDKYIKEMYKFADKNEVKNNVILSVLGIFLVCVIVFSVLINIPFLKPKEAVAVDKVDRVVAKKPVAKVAPVAVKPVETRTKIYEYLNVEANRITILKNAVDLNKGSQKGVTVHLLSEILRVNTIAIPVGTSSVEQLMKALISMDWKKNTDFTKLEKGDICFTTDMPGKPGVPSHSYVFMGWVTDGKTDYANVCDGQIDEFGTTLHKRNIAITTTQKDKFGFYLRK